MGTANVLKFVDQIKENKSLADRLNTDFDNEYYQIKNQLSLEHKFDDLWHHLEIERKKTKGNYSMQDIIKTMKPYLKDSLVANDNYIAIKDMARLFPARLTTSYLLECHLNDEKQTDWGFCAERDSSGIKMLSGDNDVRGLPEYFFENKIWQQIKLFCLKWLDSKEVFKQVWNELNNINYHQSLTGSSLYQNIINIWLEFDMVDFTSKTPLPSLFFQPFNLTGRTSDYTYLKEALTILNGDNFNQKVYGHFRECLIKLPAELRVKNVGTMLARDDNTIRFYINDIPRDDTIFNYLKSIGWPGDLKNFKLFFAELTEGDVKDKINIEIAVGEDIAARIALEYKLNNYDQSLQDWGYLLNKLVKFNLCTPVKRDGLFDWRGIDFVKFDDDPYPLLIKRFINHFKLTFDYDSTIRAKSYLRILHT